MSWIPVDPEALRCLPARDVIQTLTSITEAPLGKVVHARLDEESERILARLRRRAGLRDSEVIRRGIRALAGLLLAPSRTKIVGLGKFESGIPDLGSNKRHLRDFGRR